MTEFIQVSSLEKVLVDYKAPKKELSKISMLKNERTSYQIAYIDRPEKDNTFKGFHKVTVKSKIKKYVTVREVRNVPAQLTYFSNNQDNDHFYKKPSIYPDPLFPLQKNKEIFAPEFFWGAIWVTVEPNGEVPAGKYDIEIIFENDEGKKTSKIMNVEIIGADLPEQDMRFTQWFHTDCIATVYDTKVFSKKHWDMIEKFAKMAVRNGINMLLTPIFTPPLDTKVGGERPTVQLVGIEVKKGKYKFDFTLFEKWIKMAEGCGIKYFEISHLFSQWGAYAAPKVVANVDGKVKRIFGWDTPAVGGEYEKFLDIFLPEFIAELEKLGIKDKCFLHVSDEPQQEHLDNYLAAKNIVERNVGDMIIMDALSSFDFYSKGIVKTPIPATDHIEPFLESKIPNMWTYYCCAQSKDVCNRFFDMPSYRNRAIGAQLYKYDIKGFLHWGYNFYYSQYSRRAINPFVTTDGAGAFPAGDAFSVYPTKEGPIESLRICVFYDALQDVRAMKLLESYKGKEFVEKIIEKHWKEPVTFKTYPKSAKAILGLREEINKEIKKCL